MTPKRFAPMALIGLAIVLGCQGTPEQDPNADAAMSVNRVGYDGIPNNAMRVSSGKGVLRFRVGRSGTVWIGDDAHARCLGVYSVARDDVVEVDPYTNQVSINDQSVQQGTLTKGHRHSIFHLDARQAPR
jgi:hypothetical protein